MSFSPKDCLIAAIFAAATHAAQAQEFKPDILLDQTMQIITIRLNDERREIVPGVYDAVLTHGFYDEIVDVYCETEFGAQLDYNKGSISKFYTESFNCEPPNTRSIELLIESGGLNLRDRNDLLVNSRYAVKPSVRADEPEVVYERSASGPNTLGIVSHFQRKWDFAAGNVCLEMEEGLVDSEPYYTRDMGCYDIPPNSEYVESIRAALPQPD